jgi:hypothetical protein
VPNNVTEYVPPVEPLAESVIPPEPPGVRVTLEEFIDTPTFEGWMVVKVTVPVSNTPGKPL